MMTSGAVGAGFWLGIASLCAVIVLYNLAVGMTARLRTSPRPKSKLKLKVGSKTLLFDPDAPPDRFESQLTEVLGESLDDGPAAR